MTMHKDAARDPLVPRRRTSEEETAEQETREWEFPEAAREWEFPEEEPPEEEPPEAAPPEEEPPEEEPSVDRDWRALIVAFFGLGVIAVVAIAGFLSVPDAVGPKEVSTKGENVVAIAAAAFTAVGTALAAYFGIKAANLAREETAAAAEERSKAAEREGIRTAHLAGARPDQLGEANREATKQIKALGLDKPTRSKRR
jgi:hypothetical protein